MVLLLCVTPYWIQHKNLEARQGGMESMVIFHLDYSLGSFSMFLCNPHNAFPHACDQSQIPLLQVPFAVRVSEDFLCGLSKLHEIGHEAQNATFAPVFWWSCLLNTPHLLLHHPVKIALGVNKSRPKSDCKVRSSVLCREHCR